MAYRRRAGTKGKRMTMPHILQTEKQLAERYGIKPRKLSYWRDRRMTDHGYPRFYKTGKSVLYYLDEFDEDLRKVLKVPETMTL
jgi:hypothetical protein